MKNKIWNIKRITAWALVLAISFSILVRYDTREVYAVTKNDVVSQLNALVNQYNGKTANSGQMYMGSQCKGFANWVFLKIFGVYIGPYQQSANYKIPNPKAQTIGIIEPGNLNVNTAKALLMKGVPGDYIQVQRSTARGRGPHSMILMGVNDNGIEVFDCNSDGRNTIKKQSISWASFDTANRAMSLYRANGYPEPSSVIPPFRYHIDQAPADGTVLHNVLDFYFTGGWGLTTYGKWGVTCVNLVINGEEVLNCSRRQRDDVAAAFPDYYGSEAGFDCIVSASLLKPGKNVVGFNAYATVSNRNDVLVSYFGEHTVYYEPNCNIEACIDSIRPAGKGKFLIEGYAYDRDLDKSIDLHIYVGGEAGSGAPCYIIKADKERTDVADSKGVGKWHGFRETIYTDRFGEVPIYVYAIDATGNGTSFIGTKNVTIEKNNPPVGVLDSLTGGTDSIEPGGWLYDPDSADPAYMDIYADGPAGSGRFIARIRADKERKDVAASENIGEFHGFREKIMLGDLEGEHTFYFHAMDTDGGPSTIIGSKTVNVTKGSPPTGSLEKLEGIKGGIKLNGRCLDIDAVDKAVTLHVYVGTTAYNGARGYVISANKNYGGDFHGFDDIIYTTERGLNDVYVYALDEGSNQPNVLIGHGTVMIEQPDQEDHSHEYVKEVTKAATCSEEGEQRFTCDCGSVYSEMIPKIPHTSVIDQGIEADCQTDGLTEGSHCSVCGECLKAQEIIPKKDHENTVIKFQKDATCVCAGYTGDSYCICGKKIREGSITKQLAHTPGEEIVLKNCTETEAGIHIYTCLVCGTMGFNVIPATGRHSEDESHMHEYREVSLEAYGREERVQACACGAYVLESIPDELEKPDAAMTPAEPEKPDIDEMTPAEPEKTDEASQIRPKEPGMPADADAPANQDMMKEKGEKDAGTIFPQKNQVYRVGSFYYKVTSTKTNDGEGTVELKAPLKKTMKSVKVPSTVIIKGFSFRVTGIGKKAFLDNKKLERLSIGANVIKIGAKAFQGCSRLKKISLSGTVKSIGKNAWKGIHARAVVRVPKADRKHYKKLMKGKGQKGSVNIR